MPTKARRWVTGWVYKCSEQRRNLCNSGIVRFKVRIPKMSANPGIIPAACLFPELCCMWSWNFAQCWNFTLFFQLCDTLNNSSCYFDGEKMQSFFWAVLEWAWVLPKKRRKALDQITLVFAGVLLLWHLNYADWNIRSVTWVLFHAGNWRYWPDLRSLPS